MCYKISVIPNNKKFIFFILRKKMFQSHEQSQHLSRKQGRYTTQQKEKWVILVVRGVIDYGQTDFQLLWSNKIKLTLKFSFFWCFYCFQLYTLCFISRITFYVLSENINDYYFTTNKSLIMRSKLIKQN